MSLLQCKSDIIQKRFCTITVLNFVCIVTPLKNSALCQSMQSAVWLPLLLVLLYGEWWLFASPSALPHILPPSGMVNFTLIAYCDGKELRSTMKPTNARRGRRTRLTTRKRRRPYTVSSHGGIASMMIAVVVSDGGVVTRRRFIALSARRAAACHRRIHLLHLSLLPFLGCRCRHAETDPPCRRCRHHRNKNSPKSQKAWIKCLPLTGHSVNHVNESLL